MKTPIDMTSKHVKYYIKVFFINPIYYIPFDFRFTFVDMMTELYIMYNTRQIISINKRNFCYIIDISYTLTVLQHRYTLICLKYMLGNKYIVVQWIESQCTLYYIVKKKKPWVLLCVFNVFVNIY